MYFVVGFLLCIEFLLLVQVRGDGFVTAKMFDGLLQNSPTVGTCPTTLTDAVSGTMVSSGCGSANANAHVLPDPPTNAGVR